jgi:hypothetical protein
MSSQTLTTSLPGGLPPSPPPAPDLPDFSPPAWSDHIEAPEQSLENSHFAQPIHERTTSGASEKKETDQHRQALSNLLAQLLPNPASQQDVPAVSGDLVTASASASASAPTASLNDNNQAVVTSNHEQPPNMHLSNNPNTEQFPPYINAPFPPPTQLPDILDAQLLPPFHTPSHNNPQMPHSDYAPPLHDRREVEAFAKIEFEDGNYYITTWACELGRDALALRAALQRAEEIKKNPNGRSHSSSGRVSRPSDRIRRAGDSQVQGSVVSEAGGFAGVDDHPPVKSDEKAAESGHPSHSSQVSASDVVKPQDIHYRPPPEPFDYHGNAELHAQLNLDNEKPAPVTAEHLPNADTCPLIPIHAMANSTKSEVATHKGISRRHVRIEWDSDSECFKMKVLGRNGAFIDGVFLGKGKSMRLNSGSSIQISDIQMTFRLPRPHTDPISDISSQDDAESDMADRRSTSPTSQEAEEGGKSLTKSYLATGKSIAMPIPESLIGPDGIPIPPRKRGPGRPPKDGIMSTRERKEREKAAKLAQAKAENGGRTPPPSAKLKVGKMPEPPKPEPKIEKRKYNKRKREDEDGNVLPSIEGGEENIPSDTEKVPVKKARASKSPSPAYPPLATLTEEQLARPSEPYARLIYDILAEIHPKALPLKQIYRALKMKFPFFVYRVESEGWQSSVRHNLNQEWNKLFEKGEKEGKGFAWKAIPGALQPQAERKRAAQAAAAAKPKPQPRQPPHQGPPPPLNWQNNTPFPQHWQQGQGPPPYNQQMHSMPWPPPNGSMPHPPPGQAHSNPNMPPHQTSKPGLPQNAPVQQPPRPPYPTPQTPTTNQQFGQRPPQSSTPAAAASKNMPCTLDGLMAIRRFEAVMYEQVKAGAHPDLARWQAVFQSVKNRLLHGALASSLPGGETNEEITIMDHVERFIDRFRNPAFVGFQAASRPASPMPGQMRTPVLGESAKANTSPLVREIDAAGKENASCERVLKGEDGGAMEGVTPTTLNPGQGPSGEDAVKSQAEAVS